MRKHTTLRRPSYLRKLMLLLIACCCWQLSIGQTFNYSETSETCYTGIEGPTHIPSPSIMPTGNEISVCQEAMITICVRGDFNNPGENIYLIATGADDIPEINNVDFPGNPMNVSQFGIGFIEAFAPFQCAAITECQTFTLPVCAFNAMTEDGMIEIEAQTPGGTPGAQAGEVDTPCDGPGGNNCNDPNEACDGNCFEITSITWGFVPIATTIQGVTTISCGAPVTYTTNQAPCTNGQTEFSGSYALTDSNGNNIPAAGFSDNGDNTATIDPDILGNGDYTLSFTPGTNPQGNPSCLTPVATTITVENCCLFEAFCPANTDLGTYDCNDINTLAACPTDIPSVEVTPYNMTISDDPCGVIVVQCSDSPSIDVCGTAVQNITRTVTVFDDENGNNILDGTENSQVCTYSITINNPTPLTVSCPTAVVLPSCSTESEVAAAYATWSAGFTVSDGCNATTNIAALPTLPTFVCGGAISLDFDFTATGDCTVETCNSTFTVVGNTALAITCPDAVALPSCSTAAEVAAAYATWSGGFTVSDGCNATTNIGTLPTLPTFVCGGAISLDFDFTATGDCATEICNSTFTVAGNTALAITCPTAVSLPSCSTEAEVAAAYATWSAGFTVSDGCNATTNIGTLPALPTFVCGGAISLDFDFTATGDCATETCNSTFSVAGNTALAITCPTAVSLPSCSTEAEVIAAYATWSAGFTVSDGCNTTSNIATLPALPTFTCGAAINLSFDLTATGDCAVETCSSTFSVAGSTALGITCPDAVSLPSCSTEAEVAAAYATWAAGFTVSDGCNTVANLGNIPALPAFTCGGAVDLDFTLTATSDCGPLSCNSTFSVAANTALAITCPTAVSLPSCSTEAEVAAAYATWSAGFAVSDGCNATTNIGTLPTLPTFVCGAAISLDFDFTATGDCATEMCSSTFSVAGNTALAVTCPTAVSLPSCSTEAEVIAAYATWSAGFTVSDGCNTTSNIATLPTLPTFVCGAAINLSFDLTATGDCAVETCSSTFSVAGSTALGITCPDAVSLPSCSTAAEIAAAYATWAAGFTVSDGCNTVANLGNIPALPAFTCGGAVDLDFTLTATSDCGPLSCNSTFSVAANTALAITCPTAVSLPSCSTEGEIAAAYATWSAGFTVSDGCNATTNIGTLPALPTFVCGAAISLDFDFTATGDCATETCNSTFAVAGNTALAVTCPTAVALASCSTEGEIAAAYAAWAAGFTVSDGCNTTSNIATLPVLPTFVCGAAINLSFDLTATGDCAVETCSSTFSVAGSTALGITCPDAVSLPSCSTAAEVAAAYATWAAGFTVSDGCNTVANLGNIPALPAFTCGGAVDLDFTLTATSDCGPLSCNSTFSVAANTALAITCPTAVSLPSCSTEAEVAAAYATWSAGFTVSDGCNATTNIGTLPTLPTFVCGSAINLSFDYTATGDCATEMCNSTFAVAGNTALAITCPTAVSLASCSTEAEIAAAYATWSAGFTVSDGCNTTSNIATLPALPTFVCGTAVNLSFDLTATGDCAVETCSSTFSVAGSTALGITCPDAVSLPSCSTEAEVAAAYATWAAGFTVSDGCNTVANLGNIPALPAFTCGGAVDLDFTLTATSDCGPLSCNSTFSVAANTALAITCPTAVSLPSCSTEAEVAAAYATWSGGFTVSDGCNATTNIGTLPALPTFTCGAAINLSFDYTATGDCATETCNSTFAVAGNTALAVTCPTAVALASCSTEGEIAAAYTAWAAGFTVSDGCNTTSNIATLPALPTFVCGAAINLSFDLTATGDCAVETCSSTFSVAGSTALGITCPDAVSLPSCSTEAEVAAAYATWAAGFTVSDGCNTVANLGNIPALPAFTCGGAVDLDFTLTATSDCGPLSCNSTFSVAANTALAITCPTAVSLPSCSTESEVAAAYATWSAGFAVNNGCNVDSNIDLIPALPAFICGAGVSLDFTLSAIDDCETQSCSSTFTVTGNTPLAVSCPTNVLLPSCSTEAEIAAAYAAWAAGFIVNNGCNTVSNIDMIPILPAFTCGGGLSLDFTLIVGGDCDTQTCTSNFAVAGNTALSVTCPAAVTLASCSTEAEIAAAYATWAAGFTANDGCNTVTNISDIPVLPAFVCGGAVDLNFTLTAAGDCGMESCSSTFNVGANTALTVTCPTDVVLAACSTEAEIQAAYAAWSAGFGVNDGCNATSNIGSIPSLPVFVCGGGVDLSFTLTATDDCVTETCTSTFVVTMTPALAITCPANTTVECGGDTSPTANGTATGTSGCGVLSVTFSDTDDRTNLGCTAVQYDITRTWVLTDECNNSTSCIQIISVVDTTAPTLDCPGDFTFECDEDFSSVDTGVATNPMDDCSPASAIVINFTDNYIPGVCIGSGTTVRTWTATDLCGNVGTCVQTISIVDNTPPTVPDGAFSPIMIQCEDDIPPFSSADYNVFDNCSGVTVSSFTNPNPLGSGCPGDPVVIQRYVSFSDACGNTSIGTQEIIYEIEPIEILCGDPIAVSCPDEIYHEPIINVGCFVEYELTVEEIYTSNPNGTNCDFDNYHYEYTITDNCGRTASCVQMFAVLNEGPVFENCPLEPLYKECGNPFIDHDEVVAEWASGVVAYSQCGSAVTVTNNYDPDNYELTCGAAGSQIVTFTATDECGETTTCTSTIFNIDTKPPSFQQEASDTTATCENAAAEFEDWIENNGGANAIDCCSALTWSTLEEIDIDAIDFCMDNAIEVTFLATDDCGLFIETTATFTVVGGSGLAIMTEATDATGECGAGFEDWLAANAGAEAAAGCSDFTWSTEPENPEAPANCGETVVVTFIATDDCGATVTTVGSFMSINADLLLATAATDAAGECGTGFDAWVATNGGAAATSTCAEITWTTIPADPQLSSNCEDYSLTFVASDDCGNSVTTMATFSATDTEAPVFVDVPTELTIECSSGQDIPAPTVSDNCGEVILTYTDELIAGATTENCNNGYGYDILRTWTAMDECGNMATTTAIAWFVTDDYFGPQFTVVPANRTISCEVSIEFGEAEAITDCGVVQLTYTDIIVDGSDCKTHKFHIRTWTAIDDCGLVATATQQIEVIDDKAPLVEELEDISATCYDDNMFPTPTVFDCSEVEITFVDFVPPNICSGSIKRSWTFTDECGNVSTAVQIGMVTDSEAPLFGLTPPDITMTSAAYAVWQAPSVSAGDNCQTVNVLGPDISEINEGNTTFYEYTWTAIDGCGNINTFTQIIFIDDNSGLGSADVVPTLWTESVVLEVKKSLQVYPNPVSNDLLHIVFTTSQEQQTDLRLVNVLGQEVLSREIQTIVGENREQFNMNKLSAGTYMLQLKIGNEYLTQKIVKMD